MTSENHALQTIEKLNGVGKQIAKHLARLNIFTLQDLLLHLPSHYQDRTKVTPVRAITPETEVVVEGTLINIAKPPRGKTKLLCELKDETGIITLRFFHVLTYQASLFKIGTKLRCFGTAKSGIKGWEMIHPEFTLLSSKSAIPAQSLTPVYPATEGLSQYTLRKLTENILKLLTQETILKEYLPETLLTDFAYPTIQEALQFIHRPPPSASRSQLLAGETVAQQRLVFEELLAHRLGLLQIKQNFQAEKSIALTSEGSLTESFCQRLPFKLTNAQQRVIAEIKTDLMKAHPMLRLVQGDVGSGKTVIAALAMLKAVENQAQAALMAPTELLAEQHYRVFKAWFEPLGINVVFLSGSVKGSARQAIMQSIATAEAHIILGTHALFQEPLHFPKLALVVVDEQHRFGVQQRASFREKGMQQDTYPHQLIMTATPIPRTLAMSFYADLDCSIIDELPIGRTPITTRVLPSSRREEVMARVSEACQQGRQAYWVCPLIEESDVIACQAATNTAEELQAFLPHLKIGLIHGRMGAADKETVMRHFQQGTIHLLVATTVIEVGVDVANASLMVIENAERLGLSQLHQLRGRVGRGSMASHCVLLYQLPLSPHSKERLTVMRETTDGFKIAERDLALRGPGEVLGTRQTGTLSFRVADLIRDESLLPRIQQAADWILSERADVAEMLKKRWLREEAAYGKV